MDFELYSVAFGALGGVCGRKALHRTGQNWGERGQDAIATSRYI